MNFIKFAESKLEVKVKDSEILAIHKLRKRRDGIEPVLVQFSHNTIKRSLMKERKKLRGSDIYLNDHLTRMNSDLEKKARIMKKEGQIHSFWTINGRIFIKTRESGPKKEIKCLNDLDLCD